MVPQRARGAVAARDLDLLEAAHHGGGADQDAEASDCGERRVQVVARLGGEEFGVILPNTVLRAALTVADHVRRAVMSKELMKRSTGQNLGRVTISLGVATMHKGDTVQALIARADACLYAAKRNGRNRVICETDPEFSASVATETKVA